MLGHTGCNLGGQHEDWSQGCWLLSHCSKGAVLGGQAVLPAVLAPGGAHGHHPTHSHSGSKLQLGAVLSARCNMRAYGDRAR